MADRVQTLGDRNQIHSMKTTNKYQRLLRAVKYAGCLAASFTMFASSTAQASIAYGTINNFDTVNDTGVPCHGFEIELDDIRSSDITYTYDWNHYGTPTIREDTSIPGHTNVFIRYAAVYNNGAWSAYTAVPSAPIAPTMGHQFTNPSLNFGGEHFGAGYRAQPTVVKYNWLLDNGSGNLMVGPSVNVATPTFTIIPAVIPANPPQVVAKIVPPPPPVLPYTEFGSAGWVKEIRTTSHKQNEVKLRDLVSPDKDYPGVKDWRNGEPDEVEVEWQILQIDYNSGNGGANGELVGAPEQLGQGDDVVTRRWEFYSYTGPVDAETGEALAQSVAADGIHGSGSYSNTIVVGGLTGVQMSAFNNVQPLGVIDHLPDGEVNVQFPTRCVVIASDTNFTVTTTGALPNGMAFDDKTAQVYGTPWESGVFQFHVEVSSTNNPTIAKTYVFSIAAAGVILPPHTDVDTIASPLNAGTTTGDGVYNHGDLVTVTATANPGFAFVNWTENGTIVSASASYDFTNTLNASLVANFVLSNPGMPQITNQPASLNLNQGLKATFTVGAKGDAPLSYFWSKNGSPLANGNGIAGVTTAALTVSNVTIASSGTYSVLVSNAVGSVQSSNATLSVGGAPAISTPPTPLAVNLSAAASFNVVATGGTPLRYQWLFNNSALAGATLSSYAIAKVQATNAGNYSVVVSNAFGSITSGPVSLSINTKPAITVQPSSTASQPGLDASFSVTATGTAPLSYQWLFNGIQILGATDNSYTFTVGSPADAGSYSVTVANAFGTATSTKAKLVVNLPPVISKAVGDHLNLVGTPNVFSSAAIGSAPIGYQWFFNGTPIPGATGVSFTVSNVTVANMGNYSIVASNLAGMDTNTGTLTALLDVTPPSVVITTPTPAQELTLNALMASGTAADKAPLVGVSYSLNGGPLLPASTTNGFKNWTAVLDGNLVAGTNTLAVQATDFSGNVSVASAKTLVKFMLNVPSLLTVHTNGQGTVLPDLDQQTLYVGRNYGITALPAANWVFTNWQAGAVLASSAKLTFTMKTNLVITANFIPTPFGPGVAGTYSGLFYETNVVAFPSSGLLNVTVDSAGVISGKLYCAGAILTIANGQFDPSGHATLQLPRTAQHLPSLVLDLQVDLTGGSDSLSGSVSSADSAWTAALWCGRAIYSDASPAPFAGKYTFAFPGVADPNLAPAGASFGSINLSNNASLSLGGNLGDGTKQAQALATVAVTKQGLWPLYEPLYKAGGALIGWLSLSNTPGTITNVSGDIIWAKLANPTNLAYAAGFTNSASLVGSGYLAPASGTPVLAAPVTTITLSGGDLAAPVSASISISTLNKVVVSGANPAAIKVTIVPATGLFTGSFIDPTTGLSTTFAGSFLQNQNIGAGEFNSSNLSGSVLIQ